MQDRELVLEVSQDGWTKSHQMSIGLYDAKDGSGSGYRIAGPKFNGSSRSVMRVALTPTDRQQIREYLDLADGRGKK